MSNAARCARAPGGGGTSARVVVALFLAQSGATAGERSGAPELAGKRREIATLFTDIASFTALVETWSRACWARCSTNISSGMTDIVFAHDGTVAKIVGDALHVLFGAPGDQPDHAARAVACALAFGRIRAKLSRPLAGKGHPLGVTRIGAHAGPAIVGNFGGDRFFDYTAYGDTITWRRGSRPPTNSSAPAFARVPHWRVKSRASAAGPSAISCCAARPKRCGRSSRSAPNNLKTRPPSLMWMPSPSSNRTIRRHCGLRLPCRQRTQDQLASFHLKRLLNGQTGRRIAMD